MSLIDSYMIPITITICLILLAPIVAVDMLGIEQEPFKSLKQSSSQPKTEDVYFIGLEENINETKENIRDLMAEHEANNP